MCYSPKSRMCFSSLSFSSWLLMLARCMPWYRQYCAARYQLAWNIKSRIVKSRKNFNWGTLNMPAFTTTSTECYWRFGRHISLEKCDAYFQISYYYIKDQSLINSYITLNVIPICWKYTIDFSLCLMISFLSARSPFICFFQPSNTVYHFYQVFKS